MSTKNDPKVNQGSSVSAAALAGDLGGGEETLVCNYCGKSNRTRGWLDYHVKNCKLNPQSKNFPRADADASVKPVPFKGDSKLTVFMECPSCGYKDAIHISTGFEPKLLKCDGCGRVQPFVAWRMWAFSNTDISPMVKRSLERSNQKLTVGGRSSAENR